MGGSLAHPRMRSGPLRKSAQPEGPLRREPRPLLERRRRDPDQHGTHLRRLALEVNEQKHTIDELSDLAAQKAQQRAAEPSTGEVDVIDEEEFDFLTRLKAAKLRYRGAFEELKGSRGDARAADARV